MLRAFGVPNLPVPAHHWEPNHWFNHVQGQHYQIDADDIALEAGRLERSPVGLELPDVDSLLTEPLDQIEPSIPPWRIANTPERAEFQVAMDTAPAMPGTNDHRTIPAQHGLLDKIRSLFGIDQGHR